jgi:YVTN family beta-propeller protein
MKYQLKRIIIALTVAAIVMVWLERRHSTTVLAQGSGSYKHFEAPQVHPLAVTPDGTRLLAVNTPNNSLSVFHLTGRTLTLMAEIPVGVEPVSVAARNDREVWVTNWLSDSVSVVDLKTWNVIRTIEVGDEPTDVVFGGQQREMAFVCVSGLSQVKVYDPTAPANAPEIIAIRSKQPRALARNADGSRVFVSVFESGNQTSILGEDAVAAGGGPPPPSPALRPGLPQPPPVGLIIKWNGSSWSDERGDGRWSPFVPYSLADVDIVVLDASGASVSLNREIRNVGTHVGNAIVDPAANQLVVVNDEAHNLVRFEPNVRGRFLNSRISLVGLGNTSVSPVDLNQHIDYGNPAGTDGERALSLALPADIARATDGTLYVAATGSAKVGVLDTLGTVIARIAVGQGPTGLALNPKRKLLYVLNRFDDSLSIVDTITRTQIATVPVGFNPEPTGVTRGRRFLYDSSLSAHGDLSCASCHANGHRDGIAWDLGDPTGNMQTVPNPQGAPFGFGASTFHPMKGPMITQSLRGITGTEPLHWRGDRAALNSFNPAFVSLLGGPRQLTGQEMADFQAFVTSLSYPPNPNENLDRTMPNPPTGPSAARGQQLFNNNLFDGGVFTCNTCHTANNFGTGTNGALIPAFAIDESQDLKVPQLRGEYQKTGFFRAPGEQITGYGFIHDGSTDTLFSFLHANPFVFQNDNQRRDIEQFLLAFDSGIAPAVGLQVTVDADNKATPAVTNRISLLQSQAAATNCDLVVRGLYNGTPRGFLYTPANGQFQTDKQGEAAVSLATLLGTVGTRAELTFSGVPVGAGRRNSIDLDGNGILNRDEPLTPNALDSAMYFVWQHYRDFLSRDPDTGGLDYWTSQITNCGTDPACIHSQRIGVSAAFFIELEFQETGYVVYRMYRGAYGSRINAPTRAAILFNQFIADRSLIVGGAGLPQSTINYANTFVARPEFIQAYPAGLLPAEFVESLYGKANLDGAEFATQRQAAIDGLTAGTKTRGQVLLDLIDIQQFKDREYNPAFVLMQYFGYLRRDPDQGGYDFWLNILNASQPRNFRGMVCSFITSTEYQLRSGPHITRSNQDCQ